MSGPPVSITVNTSALVVFPPPALRVMGPVDARTGTMATPSVPFSNPEKEADTPLKRIDVTSTRFEPETVTCVPGGPSKGVKLTMTGGSGGGVSDAVARAG